MAILRTRQTALKVMALLRSRLTTLEAPTTGRGKVPLVDIVTLVYLNSNLGVANASFAEIPG